MHTRNCLSKHTTQAHTRSGRASVSRNYERALQEKERAGGSLISQLLVFTQPACPLLNATCLRDLHCLLCDRALYGRRGLETKASLSRQTVTQVTWSLCLNNFRSVRGGGLRPVSSDLYLIPRFPYLQRAVITLHQHISTVSANKPHDTVTHFLPF